MTFWVSVLGILLSLAGIAVLCIKSRGQEGQCRAGFRIGMAVLSAVAVLCVCYAVMTVILVGGIG